MQLPSTVTAASADNDQQYAWSPLPTRDDMLKSLQTEQFDVLVIGGGATGAGVALDSTSRGGFCFEVSFVNV